MQGQGEGGREGSREEKRWERRLVLKEMKIK